MDCTETSHWSDNVYYFSGMLIGASETYTRKSIPAVLLMLTTGALAASLRDRLLFPRNHQHLAKQTINALSHTVADAFHMVSGIGTGVALGMSCTALNADNKPDAAKYIALTLAIIFGSSCTATLARNLANKTNQK